MTEPLEPPKFKTIDADARGHSGLYELKPMSRWWLIVVSALCLFVAFANGFERFETWALLLLGCGLGFAMILVFPRYWLSKITD